MTEIAIGKKIPNIALHLTGDQTTTLAAYRGKSLVLYFYPKANTPGCTQEGLDFTAAINKFEKRFRYMEQAFTRQGTELEAASRDDMDRAWDTAKENVSSPS